ncbi:TPA: inverse autotransporter beta domain-containing protein, partial [Yersinia enterocolitica]|nr:inverse autotransporter beta domain-containing protein [Yersinia enterocolitica]
QMARSAVSNQLNHSAHQWLNQFGTARVQLNVNDKGHLDGSAADVLIPVYDTQKNLLFTQLGARNKDSRTTVNIGAGARTVHHNWMYGLNTFFDNDITGNNRRVGLGAEAWTDYLKLSANSYFGLTDWHQSRDFADYNERPANGYDVRAEAWLPAYPQLGGKLMYEKYRGDEVALFGRDNRQKNPDALTAGLNYTPVPLVTLGVEHRAGHGSQNDSSINLQLNYRLGASWQSHIDPSAVAASRTLAGSRYDLVERNNHIVLDYKKQELVHVILPTQVSGEAGSVATVNAQVSTKYAFDRLTWDGAALVAAGGSISAISAQTVAIKMPPYLLTGSSSNVYTLGVIAYDKQGNASPRVTVPVTVMPGTASLTSLTVTTDNARANGIATNAVQTLVTDANGNPLAGQAVTFSANNNATVTAVTGTTGADGLATATLTSATAGTSVVTATLTNSASATVNTTFVADSSTATIASGHFTVTTDNAAANTTANNAVQAIVTDANGNPLAGQAVTFSANNNATVTAVTGTTGADGLATATLTSATVGTSVVTATLSNGASATVNTTFVADSSTATIADGDFTVTTDNAVANGTATNALSATVKDAQGNPVGNIAVTFAVTSGDATPTGRTVQTNTQGVATASLVSVVAGDNAVTASVGNMTTAARTSSFVADSSTATIASGHFTVTTDNAPANTTANNAVQAIVTDAHGNLLAGQAVTFSAS